MTQHVRQLWLLAALVATAAACGRPSEAPAGLAASPAVNQATGTVSGRVTFDGAPPVAVPVSMTTDPNCRPSGVVTAGTIAVGTDKGLQNTFVYVKEGLGAATFPVPATAVVLDQQGCRYVPRVVGVQVGQPLDVINSDPTFHNIHAVGRINREFNIGQPSRSLKMTHTFTTSEVMVPFKCDVHDWMTAWVGVLDHPFFAVTGADGSFELKGLPPGTYTLESWHETLGVQTRSVVVSRGATATASFTFKG